MCTSPLTNRKRISSAVHNIHLLRETVMACTVFLAMCLLAVATAHTHVSPECNRILSEETGIGGADKFFQTVMHGVHSLTLEDLRHYFEPDAPVDNGIPTVNTDLSSPDEILPNAPSVGGDP